MVVKPVRCPRCDSIAVVKYGKSAEGKQRFLCQNSHCDCHTFILDHSYKGRLRKVKEQIIDMRLNGSGIRDISRVLQISPSTVIETLKKSPSTPIRQSGGTPAQ